MSGKLNVLRRLGTTAKNSLAVLGFCTVVYTAKEVHGTFSIFDSVNKTARKKKKILVLPFHKMKIVEQKKPSFSNLLDKLSSGKEDAVMEVEIRELVDAIHAAAADPDVVALHGTFGQGFGFQCGGYGHIEEIRNAIRVFNESHRRHYEPKICSVEEKDNRDGGNCAKDTQAEIEPVQKVSFAFADTFDNPSDPGNKEYFLASAFSQIHMQPRGNMQLFGVSISNIFIADALKKYGIKVHVFKHGIYKNAPNSVTERGYTRHHYENTKAILDSINQSVYSMISQSRNLPKLFDNTVWKHIHNYGTMTAENCKEIHLVDHLPKVNPLMDLVKMNASKDVNDQKSEYLREKHAELIDKLPFEANEALSLSSYLSEMQVSHKRQRRRMQFYDKLNYAVKRSTAFEALLNLFSCQAPYYYFDRKEVDDILSKGTQDKVSVVYVSGPINDKLAQRVTRALRQIKDDERIKCIILRVDSPGGAVTASETILEECKDTGKPIVCSFANVAASGGYYISTCAEKIFSQQTTLTGSIGVFGIKIDAVEAAKRYGIEVSSISSSRHAQTYSLFHPLNDAMEMNLKRNMNRIYDYFKQLVSDGRKIPIEHVEEVARGRVWTGVEAKEKRLVDDFGGLHKAVSYASSEYASAAAEVETYPKAPTLQEQLHRLINGSFACESISILPSEFFEALLKSTVSPCSVLLCMDESYAIESSLLDFHNTLGID
jgi:signal peptide peptidase SppA